MSAWGLVKEGKLGAAIVRVIESVFGITVPAPLANLIDDLTSDAGMVAKSFAQTAWDAANDNDPLSDIIDKAYQAAKAEGKDVVQKQIADWVGIIDRDQSAPDTAAIAAPTAA